MTPEIAAKAKELTRDAKDDREKVLALYNYVTGLRYVAVPLGVNSFRPHAAANVLQNQFGDCKDKANLFNALLHSLEIEARLVLVPRFSQAHEDLPGLSFNHAISRVTLGGETVWVDTTDDVCRFGMLPPGDPGRKVLVIDGQTTALTQLPAPDPKRAPCSRCAAKWIAPAPMDALPVKLNATALGYPDYELRTAAREAKEHGFSVPLLAAKFHPVGRLLRAGEPEGDAGVRAGRELHLAAPRAPGSGPARQRGRCGLLRAPFWLPKEWDAALHRRKAGLLPEPGLPADPGRGVRVPAAGQGATGVLPGVRESKTGPLRWRVEWAKIGEGKLVARLQAELARGELSAAETPAVQKQLRALLAAWLRARACRRQ